MNLPEQLTSKIAINPGTGCWEWTAYRERAGYGRVFFRGRSDRAHRVVFHLLVGPTPEGKELDHLCRVRHCVNPAHLEPVTRRENVLRGTSPSAECARKTHCKCGRPYDGVSEKRRWCRTCVREAQRKWIAEHPEYREQRRQYSARYYASSKNRQEAP